MNEAPSRRDGPRGAARSGEGTLFVRTLSPPAQATVDPPQKYETIASAIREPQDDHDAPAPAR